MINTDDFDVAYMVEESEEEAEPLAGSSPLRPKNKGTIALRSYFPETWLWQLHDIGCVITDIRERERERER